MLQLNKVHLAGNLVADPEFREFPEPTKGLVKFTIAVNRVFKDKKEAAFIDCEAWGQAAVMISRYFVKGSPIYIEGRLKTDEWQTQAGEKRRKLMVVADSWQFVESGSNMSDQAHHRATPPVAQPARAPAPAASIDDEPPF